MKRLFLAIALLGAAFTVPQLLPAQAPSSAFAGNVSWYRSTMDKGRWDLYQDGKHLGSWFRIPDGKYYPINHGADLARIWGEPSDLPVAIGLPEAGTVWKRPLDWKTAGVDTSKLSKVEAYGIGMGGESHSVTEAAAMRALKSGTIRLDVKGSEVGDPDLPDDSSKFWLLVIGGTPEVRKKVVDDWNASPDSAAWRDKTNVWSVDANHISVKDNRDGGKPLYFTGGNPTVYLLGSDGTVLHRQDDYKGPADFAALRKLNQAYDPSKDKDLRAADPLGPLGGKGFPGWILLAMVGAAGLFAHQKLPEPKLPSLL